MRQRFRAVLIAPWRSAALDGSRWRAAMYAWCAFGRSPSRSRRGAIWASIVGSSPALRALLKFASASRQFPSFARLAYVEQNEGNWREALARQAKYIGTR